jgi:predicted RNase H-like nuclease
MPHPLPPPRPIVAGVDGCRAGWLVVLHDPATNTHAARVVTAGFAALLTLPEAPAIIAVDIPIGLLDVAATGGRACEIAARERLPGRASSVFSSPTRPALAAQQRPGAGYRDVVAANRSGVDGAPGISQQAFAILPKIGEVDAALTPALQAVVREIHPELSFATAAGAPMAHAKKTRAGQAERIRVLEALGFREPAQLFGRGLPPGCQLDDLLDACIACWTARCIADGHATTLPAEPPTDARGLRMELWVPTVAPVEVAAAPVEDDALTAAALRLPEAERRVLAQRLLASLEEGVGGA